MTKILLDNLCFPEGPRWHEGRLWFSELDPAALRDLRRRLRELRAER